MINNEFIRRDLFYVAVPSQENTLNAFTPEITVDVSAVPRSVAG